MASAGDRWEEEEWVLISALEHEAYCPRQCALIHVDQTFDENIYTLRGRHAHERVDETTTRAERGVRIERGLPLWSRRLGLVGKADVIEFQGEGETPYPVEYKVGMRREWAYEAIQVCAQALCLEEMLGRPAPTGAVYYVGSRMRREVVFTAELRAVVERLTAAVRATLRSGVLPSAPDDQRCPKCSLLDSCLPAAVARSGRLAAYRAMLFTPQPEGAPPAKSGLD